MIELSVPSFIGKEKKYLIDCIKTGWVSSGGKYVTLFEKKIKSITGAKYAVACINGTSALHIALKLVGVKNDDEVIAPTITFIASINAIKYNNANPIFMDVDKYFNIDIDKTLEFLKKNTFFNGNYSFNKKTKKRISAILIAHMYGNAANIGKIYRECKKRKIKIVEDAAESLGSKYIKGKFKGRHTGTIGEVGCLSFNGNKIITSGGGGAILTNNKKLKEKALYYITQAKDDSLNYIHNQVGYNYRLSNLHSAVGFAQLQNFGYYLNKKKLINKIYKNRFSNLKKSFELSDNPEYAKNNYWINILRSKKKISKNLVRHLIKNKIFVRPIWYPNHLQKIYKNCEKYKIKNALDLLKSCICLPSSVKLSKFQLNKIIKIINSFK